MHALFKPLQFKYVLGPLTLLKRCPPIDGPTVVCRDAGPRSRAGVGGTQRTVDCGRIRTKIIAPMWTHPPRF